MAVLVKYKCPCNKKICLIGSSIFLASLIGLICAILYGLNPAQEDQMNFIRTDIDILPQYTINRTTTCETIRCEEVIYSIGFLYPGSLSSTYFHIEQSPVFCVFGDNDCVLRKYTDIKDNLQSICYDQRDPYNTYLFGSDCDTKSHTMSKYTSNWISAIVGCCCLLILPIAYIIYFSAKKQCSSSSYLHSLPPAPKFVPEPIDSKMELESSIHYIPEPFYETDKKESDKKDDMEQDDTFLTDPLPLDF
ncbi:MAG: hypothetical protein Sylvanvirus2_17 [Sylvanvirus sp.]|uniref:Uncharacterized protein n=1 Tax=Sylvanvirus sp. TaxID=2487774 RepID=A0A3G5AJF1_9VIRU|nr:MAG: hypothetical protein Sylvanvirus2_17 [Sylvanvirus sp.]